jgi:O-antigen ligase
MPTLPSLNGELIVFVLVWVIVFIITLASDTVDWPAFITASVVLAAAYMISRGIAKAGKVLETHSATRPTGPASGAGPVNVALAVRARPAERSGAR